MTPRTILYVEDEADDVFFMRRAFDRSGVQSRLHTVENGELAIDYLAGRGPFADRELHPYPAFVLLDLNLPLRSGFEVLQWIRSDPSHANLTVVIFSSSGRPEDRTRASELGATAYLQKPSSGRAFLNLLEDLKVWL